jgi:hypothetical protein
MFCGNAQRARLVETHVLLDPCLRCQRRQEFDKKLSARVVGRKMRFMM